MLLHVTSQVRRRGWRPWSMCAATKRAWPSCWLRPPHCRPRCAVISQLSCMIGWANTHACALQFDLSMLSAVMAVLITHLAMPM